MNCVDGWDGGVIGQLVAPGQVPHLQMGSDAGFSLLDKFKASACTVYTSQYSAYNQDKMDVPVKCMHVIFVR